MFKAKERSFSISCTPDTYRKMVVLMRALAIKTCPCCGHRGGSSMKAFAEKILGLGIEAFVCKKKHKGCC